MLFHHSVPYRDSCRKLSTTKRQELAFCRIGQLNLGSPKLCMYLYCICLKASIQLKPCQDLLRLPGSPRENYPVHKKRRLLVCYLAELLRRTSTIGFEKGSYYGIMATGFCQAISIVLKKM